MEEIAAIRGLQGQELNNCKSILAYEVTALTHGHGQAQAAHEGATQAFGRRLIPRELLPSSKIPREMKESDGIAIPTTLMDAGRLERGIPVFELLVETGLCASRSAARRLVQQGGAYVNQARIAEVDERIGAPHITAEGILVKAGKKKIHRIVVRR
jgi:tyrosyl-tRNA synthetase